MASSNPPSRGGSVAPKTYGKHEVPMLSVEADDSDGGAAPRLSREGRQHASFRIEVIAKGTAQVAPLAHSSSFANLTADPPSGANSPLTMRKRVQPSGIKLPAPPPALLNGLANSALHKSSSSASLSLSLLRKNGAANAVAPAPPKSDRPNGEIDNAAQPPLNLAQLMLVRKAKEAATAAAPSPARLPPLQLPKGPNADEERREEEQREQRNRAEGEGMIATVATNAVPQMQPLEPIKVNLSATLLPPPPPDIEDPFNNTSASAPIPVSRLASHLPQQQQHSHHHHSHHVPNQVPMPQPAANRLRRSSSAGQLPLSRDALASISGAAHKPLPEISEPKKFADDKFGVRSANKPRTKQKPWRFMMKGAMIVGFLSIPVVIFVLMMFSSDGFAPGAANGTTISTFGPTISAPLEPQATTTPANHVNIVGGAIFQPISMQNESAAIG